jgi:hypothetical protein
MAGLGLRTWVPGEVITADNIQQYLQDQAVQVYADAAARNSNLIGFLSEGMVSYLKDTNSVEVYDGSAWVGLGGDAPIFTAGSTGQFLKSLGTAGVDWDDVPLPASATPTTEGIVYGRQLGTAAGTALTAYGYNAGPLDYNLSNQTGSTYIGFEAGKVAERGSNTGVGHLALTATTNGGSNTAVGASAMLANTTGSFNVAVGLSALAANVTSQSNTAIGQTALSQATGGFNTGIGAAALSSQTTGQLNTAIGYLSGPALTSTGSNNTLLGSEISNFQAMNGSNNTLIGHGAVASSASVSNEITLGNGSITTIRAQVTSITSLSDERDKTDVEDLQHGLDFVNQLRPVAFKWWQRKPESVTLPDGTVHEFDDKNLKRDEPDMGFIAQDIVALEDALGEHDRLRLSYRSNPEALEVTQGRLIPILVKAIQELSAEVESLKSQL